MQSMGFLLLTLNVLAVQTGVLPGTSLMHPTFEILDSKGEPVLRSGGPISTMRTCGNCHDTDYIANHSFHADVGLRDLGPAGETASGRAWDTSPGFFGRWSPMLYRYLTPEEDDTIDLGTASWLQQFGARHVGGGPAEFSRNGQPLADLTAGGQANPETHIADPDTGETIPWDWQASGGIEMNCFLCHIPQPNNEKRTEALASGQFRWANTATLVGSGIVQQSSDGWQWNREAFDESGHLKKEFLKIQDPADANCGLCHGLVHPEQNEPIISTGCRPDHWSTETTGQILSPQRIANSGLNLAGKQELSRAWDIHSERLVKCIDCHYSLNNPIYRLEDSESRPAHLIFDARRMDISEYLHRPSHQFARGEVTQTLVAPELKASMRRCVSCHDPEPGHQGLPYYERHFTALSCETCHIPRIYAPARRAYDWTVVTVEGEPGLECRGIEGDRMGPDVLIRGFEPVLLERQDTNGTSSLRPYNLVSAWFWVAGNPERPVKTRDLMAVYLDGDTYAPEILEALDSNRNGELDDTELKLDTPEKVDLIANRLSGLGLDDPHIVGEIQPFGIHHNVTGGEWATRSCLTCHSRESRIARPMILASHVPGGVVPKMVGDANVSFSGETSTDAEGRLVYVPSSAASGLYVLGHDSLRWANLIGLLAVLGVIGGVAIHGGLRLKAAAAASPSPSPVDFERVYMYSAYERLWHWLQSLGIMVLILTGLEIHFPDTVGLFGFKTAVLTHNIVGFVLVANAFLSAFYHLASGEIRQYLPQPKGFFSQAIQQTLYYVRGIFRGESHPFEKAPQRKLNPLQQMTYLIILNVLLPVQVLTGLMIWGAERWPQTAQYLGGLSLVAPLHALTAWMFVAFLIMHIYLTTTGHTPLANIKAMVGGWEEIPIHNNHESGGKPS